MVEAYVLVQTEDALRADVVPAVQQVAGITRTVTCPIADGAQP